MRLFLVTSDLAFSSLQSPSDDEWPWRGGAPVAETWRLPQLVLSEGGAEQFIAVDCFTMTTGTDGLVLSGFAHSALQGLLQPFGEFWPVQVYDHRYWWFNSLACIPALDRTETDAEWGSVDGPWGSFRWITSTRRLAFRAEALTEAPPLFRIPEYPQGALFGGERLLEAVRTHELTGFRFQLVWSSADGGVVDPPGISLAGTLAAEESEGEKLYRRAQAAAIVSARSDPTAGS